MLKAIKNWHALIILCEQVGEEEELKEEAQEEEKEG